MTRGPARTLNANQFTKLLEDVERVSLHPAEDLAFFLLSFYAGLRVQEIAGLKWEENLLDVDGDWRTVPVLGAKGRVSYVPCVYVSRDIGKYGQERTIAMQPELAEALRDLREQGNPSPFVIPSMSPYAGQDLKSKANALRVRLNRLYRKLGFPKCTTHTGRRTFITQKAQQANLKGASLKDVQKLAGHAQLSTTEGYIDMSPMQANLAMAALW